MVNKCPNLCAVINECFLSGIVLYINSTCVLCFVNFVAGRQRGQAVFALHCCLKAEIVETTFRSRFRFSFRFLKYPLFKKVFSFRVPEIFSDNRETKRNDCLYFGYPKRNNFLKRGYFKKQKRKQERKVVSTISG